MNSSVGEVLQLPLSPQSSNVIDTLEQAFEELANDIQYQAGVRVSVPGVGRLYGLRVPMLREMAGKIVRAYSGDTQALKAIASDIWARGSREHRLVALFMMAKAKLTPFERWDLGLQFIQDVQNWEICDQLCMALLGQALAEDPEYMNEIETWVEDDDLWIRRAAVVTPILLRRAKYQPDLALELDRRTLAICQALIDDGEKYIRKAVDWSIREVIGRNYDLARDWMIEQAAGLPSKISRSTLKKAAKKLMPADYDSFICIIEGNI